MPTAHLLVDIQRNRALVGHELRIKRVGDIDLGPSGALPLAVVLEGVGMHSGSVQAEREWNEGHQIWENSFVSMTESKWLSAKRQRQDFWFFVSFSPFLPNLFSQTTYFQETRTVVLAVLELHFIALRLKRKTNAQLQFRTSQGKPVIGPQLGLTPFLGYRDSQSPIRNTV